MDTKTTSIVAYVTWIGLIIALVAGDKEVDGKGEFGAEIKSLFAYIFWF